MNEKETPSSPTPEYIKRISEAIQSAETREENRPATKTTEQLRTEQELITQKIASETQGLNAVRAKLGLPETNTSNAISALREKEVKLSSQPESEQPETLEPHLQKSLRDVADNIGRLGIILKRRDADRLDELLPQNDVSRLLFAARQLSDPQSFSQEWQHEISNMFGAIDRSLRAFGSIRTTGGIRENAESLRSIAIFSGEASKTIDDFVHKMNSLSSPEAQTIVSVARSTSRSFEEIGHKVRKMATALDGYKR